MRLGDAEPEIRRALERLAGSPLELLCFVIIECPVTKRFVQFCTPPPPSWCVGSPRLSGPEPLIFDGTGSGKPGGYVRVDEFCDVDRATSVALDTLSRYLPEEAELRIVEESTHLERPS